MAYFQIAVFPVPSDNRDAYKAFTEKMSPLFMEYGALQIFEGWGDMVPEGKITSLPMAVKLEEGETICASFIEWPDPETADACVAAMGTDARFAEVGDMPFDGSRVIFGTFEALLKL